MNIKFSAIIKNYGYVLGQAKILLNSREYFTLKGLELEKEFDDRLQLSFEKFKKDETTASGKNSCTTWSECKFKFESSLKPDDTVKISIELVSLTGTVIEGGEFFKGFYSEVNKRL